MFDMFICEKGPKTSNKYCLLSSCSQHLYSTHYTCLYIHFRVIHLFSAYIAACVYFISHTDKQKFRYKHNQNARVLRMFFHAMPPSENYCQQRASASHMTIPTRNQENIVHRHEQ